MDSTNAYLAGIIDGEGSIMLGRNRKSEMPSPTISITSTDHELIEWLLKEFGGREVRQKVYKEHHKLSWIWRVNNRKALEVLELVVPFLKINRKRQRAEILLGEYLALTPRNGKYTDEMLAAKQSLMDRFEAIK